MRASICSALFLPILLLMVHVGFAQQIDSMMGVYADQLRPEKIHIHFDKTIYNKGETIWYKMYLLQGNDTAAVSKNVYINWYDAAGNLISTTTAPILLSTAQGSFEIPANYHGESLQIKAFTRWMLNEDPDFSYHRVLKLQTNQTNSTQPTPNKTKVELFPEGGFLIHGLQSRVAFKASNQYGHPVFIKGVIVDNSKEVIDSLKVQHDGMGSFYLLPLIGQTYQLQWMDEYGSSGSTSINISKSSGANMHIKASKGKAWFQIERTEQVPENFKKMTLVVHMNQIGLYQIAINTTEKTKITSELPLKELPTGLLQFTLFTADWIPIAERVVFVNNHSHEFKVQLKSTLINVDKRGKNLLEVFVPDTTFTNMSMSITDASISTNEPHTIYSDLLLSSEIKGKIHHPGYYFSSDDDIVASRLDLVMLTNGWRRFDWEKIKANIPPKISYPMETEYMKVQGNVVGMKNKNGTQILNMFVVRKDSSKQMIFVPVAADGSFEYPQFFFDTAKLFYNFNNNTNLTEKAKLSINNGLFKQTTKGNLLGNSLPFYGNDSIAEQRLHYYQVQQALLKQKQSETTLEEVIVTTKAKTKEQILSEKYSSGFFSRGEAGTFDLTDSKMVFSRNILEYLQSKVAGLDIIQNRVSWRGDIPTFFLNEMAVDQETATNIDMNNIAMIKVFRPPFMFATGGGRGGAIAIYTKKGGDNNQAVNIKGMEYLELEGYTRFKEFYSPNYEQQIEGITNTDSRTTLYWSPNMITNKTLQTMQIEFYNNDFSKSFQVVIEGINAAGKMTRVVKTIDVLTKTN